MVLCDGLITVEELAKHNHTMRWHANSIEGYDYARGNGSMSWQVILTLQRYVV